MKIVYLSSSTIPSRAANSIHVMKMCQAFAKNGHEVVLVAPDNRNSLESGVDDVYEFYGVEKCFEISKLPLPPIRGRGQIYGLWSAVKAKSLKTDLAFCRNISSCFFAAKFGLPVIYESHMPAEDSGNISEWTFNRLVQSPRLKKLVVITHALKDYYLTNNPGIKCPIQVAPDGADPVPGGIVPVDLPNKEKRLQVGYVGHLYQGRGVDIIIHMAKSCPWADFHLIGGTEQDIRSWKTKISESKNIIFHGFVSPAVAEKMRISMDVLLAPYQNKVSISGRGNTVKWMSPLKIFEYMAAGKPIISSDLPVLREVLNHEQNALLCPPDDALEWKNALEGLKDDPQLAKSLAQAAYVDFMKNYTWQARAERLIGGSNVH